MEKKLQKTSLFRDFPEEIIRRCILPQGQVSELPRGRYVIEPQQRIDQFGVILTGKIHVLHLFPDGKFSLMTALMPGEILGIDLICTHSRIAPYHAVASAPTQIISFPRELILEPGILPEEYRIRAMNRLLTIISHDNMKKEYRLAILSQKGLRERITTYLLMQSAKRGTSTFRIPFTREEMASFLCVNRSALSHELSLMEQEGLLSFRRNQFTLHHPEKWTVQNTYTL